MKKFALLLLVIALVAFALPTDAFAKACKNCAAPCDQCMPKAKKPVIDIPIQQPLPVYVPPAEPLTLLYEFGPKIGWDKQTCLDHKVPAKQDMHRGFAQTNGFGNLHKNVRVYDITRPIVKNYDAKKGF